MVWADEEHVGSSEGGQPLGLVMLSLALVMSFLDCPGGWGLHCFPLAKYMCLAMHPQRVRKEHKPGKCAEARLLGYDASLAVHSYLNDGARNEQLTQVAGSCLCRPKREKDLGVKTW